MNFTVDQIANLVKGRVTGNGSTVITGAAPLNEAKAHEISFLKDMKDNSGLKQFETTAAGAVITGPGCKKEGKTVIEVENPLLAFSTVLFILESERKMKKPGVHKLASVASSARIGQNVTIGPFCVIEDNAEIGDNVHLWGQNYIGSGAVIGKDTILYPQAVVREEVKIGERCVIHAGAVIGSDGYGFFFAGGKHNKIPQIGTVLIGDDVEIGSCTTIDRATMGATVIGKGTKIDNQVQVAHNVEVGENSLLVAQVGIAGSSKIGKGVVIGGQAGVADHVNIGDGVQVGAASGVTKNVEAGSVLWGMPAEPIRENLKIKALLRRLPELFQQMKEVLEKSERQNGK